MGIFGVEERNPIFKIKKAKDNEYYFVLFAKNGEKIATSEMYTSKENCKNGIESVKKNAPLAVINDTTEK